MYLCHNVWAAVDCLFMCAVRTASNTETSIWLSWTTLRRLKRRRKDMKATSLLTPTRAQKRISPLRMLRLNNVILTGIWSSLVPLQQRISYRIIALVGWRSLLVLIPGYLRDLACTTLSAPGRRSHAHRPRCPQQELSRMTPSQWLTPRSLIGSCWHCIWILFVSFNVRVNKSFSVFWGSGALLSSSLEWRYINLCSEWMGSGGIRNSEISTGLCRLVQCCLCAIHLNAKGYCFLQDYF